MKKIYLYTIILFIIILFVLTIRNGWIEPDSYAFISRACGTSEFETPILAKTFFNSLGCNKSLWFLNQALMWSGAFFLIAKYFLQKKIPIENIFIMGFSLSVIYSLLAIEDDFLITGYLFVLTYWLFDNTTNLKRILFLLTTIFFGTFIWKGSYLIGLIILGGTISPILSLGVIAFYVFQNGLNDWGGSSEAIIFNGYSVFFPIILLLFFSTKKSLLDFYEKNKRFSQTFLALTFLGFFQIKWGLYSAFFLPLLFYKTVPIEKLRDILIIGGLIIFFGVILIGLTKSPNQEHWNVLYKTLEIQNFGGKIMISNSFGLEKWGFEYIGGKPTQFDEYNQIRPFYYLGVNDLNCEIIIKKDNLRLENCV